MSGTISESAAAPVPLPHAFRNLTVNADGRIPIQRMLSQLVNDVAPWPECRGGSSRPADLAEASDRLEGLVQLCGELARLIGTGMRSGQVRDLLVWLSHQAQERVREYDAEECSLADYTDERGRDAPSREQFMRAQSIRVAIARMLMVRMDADLLPHDFAGMDNIADRISESYDLIPDGDQP